MLGNGTFAYHQGVISRFHAVKVLRDSFVADADVLTVIVFYGVRFTAARAVFVDNGDFGGEGRFLRRVDDPIKIVAFRRRIDQLAAVGVVKAHNVADVRAHQERYRMIFGPAVRQRYRFFGIIYIHIEVLVGDPDQSSVKPTRFVNASEGNYGVFRKLGAVFFEYRHRRYGIIFLVEREFVLLEKERNVCRSRKLRPEKVVQQRIGFGGQQRRAQRRTFQRQSRRTQHRIHYIYQRIVIEFFARQNVDTAVYRFGGESESHLRHAGYRHDDVSVFGIVAGKRQPAQLYECGIGFRGNRPVVIAYPKISVQRFACLPQGTFQRQPVAVQQLERGIRAGDVAHQDTQEG